MNCWAPGNPNLFGLGQPHLGWVYHSSWNKKISRRQLLWFLPAESVFIFLGPRVSLPPCFPLRGASPSTSCPSGSDSSAQCSLLVSLSPSILLPGAPAPARVPLLVRAPSLWCSAPSSYSNFHSRALSISS
jgi:hypothetical protein